MSIMPPQNLKEWLLYNPTGVVFTVAFLVIMLALAVRIYLDWPTTRFMIDMSKAVCIGGACP